jgi:hypothetical protein
MFKWGLVALGWFHNNKRLLMGCKFFKVYQNLVTMLTFLSFLLGHFLPCKDTFRCSHNPTSQKGRKTTKKNNQNWINIYVLPFKTMAIMGSHYFFIHMNVKEFKPKIHLIKF